MPYEPMTPGRNKVVDQLVREQGLQMLKNTIGRPGYDPTLNPEDRAFHEMGLQSFYNLLPALPPAANQQQHLGIDLFGLSPNDLRKYFGK